LFDKKCIFEWHTHSKGIFFIWNPIWFKFFIIVFVSCKQHRPVEWVASNWTFSKYWFQKNLLTVMDNKIAFTGVVHVNGFFETKQCWIISCFLLKLVHEIQIEVSLNITFWDNLIRTYSATSTHPLEKNQIEGHYLYDDDEAFLWRWWRISAKTFLPQKKIKK
jgi:hypothetical protein